MQLSDCRIVGSGRSFQVDGCHQEPGVNNSGSITDRVGKIFSYLFQIEKCPITYEDEDPLADGSMAIRKRQSRKIFVAKKVYKSWKGAEHRNITTIGVYISVLCTFCAY